MSDAVISSLKIEIETDSKNTGNALDSLIKRLERLENICNGTSNAQEKVSSSSSKMYDRLSKIQSVLSRASSFMRSFTNKCAEWFNASNDYVEAVNLFSVTMGNGADEAKRYADTLQDLMGIDVQEWMNYQGSYNQMLNGFGLDSNISNEMSQQLTQIAYDLSSLWNVNVETAFKKVQSGMSGQIKGLKVWGINLSVAQLKETALAHGIELSTAKMTEAQKATLRYVTLMEKTTNVQGDLARTIVTPANAMRILTAQTTRAKRALGNIVSVLVVKFIPVMQTVVLWLERMANSIASKLGYELPEIDYSGIDLSSSYVDDLDDSLSEATENAKKLKKTLLGFDELNVLNSESTASTATALGGGLPSDLGLDLSQYSYDFTEGIETSGLDAIKEKFKDILWYAGAIAGALLGWNITSLLGQITPLQIGFKQTLGIALTVAGAILMIKGSVDALNNGVNLQNFIETFIGAGLVVGGLALAFGGIGAAIGALVSGVVIAVVGIIDAVKNGINVLNGTEIMGGFALIGAGIGGLIGGPAGAAIGALIGLVVGAITNLVIYISQNWEEVKQKFSDFETWVNSTFIQPIVNFFSPIFSFFNDAIIQPIWNVISTLCSAISEWANAVWSNIVEIATGIWEAIKTVATKIGEIVNTIWEIISTVVGYIWDKITGVLESVKDFLSPIAQWIYDEVLKPVYDFVVKVNNWISDKISGLINGIKDIAISVANGVAEIIKRVLNGVFGIAEDIINFFIRGLNNVVDIINITIPGASISKVEEVSIPKFATGAMNIPKGQLFQARESGPELVGTIGNKSAVVNNDQIVASVEGGVYRGVRDAIADSGERSDGGDHSLVVMIGGEVVHKGFVKWHNDEVKITGRSPLNV